MYERIIGEEVVFDDLYIVEFERQLSQVIKPKKVFSRKRGDANIIHANRDKIWKEISNVAGEISDVLIVKSKTFNATIALAPQMTSGDASHHSAGTKVDESSLANVNVKNSPVISHRVCAIQDVGFTDSQHEWND